MPGNHGTPPHPPSPDGDAADFAEAFVGAIEAADHFEPLLLKVRTGAPAARKQALRQLVGTADVRPLLEAALAAAAEPQIETIERHRVIKLVSRILLREHDTSSTRAVTSLTAPLLHFSQSLLVDSDRFVRAMGQELLASLARIVGLRALLSALRPEFDTADDGVRLACASSIAAVVCAFGVPLLLPLLRALTADDAPNVRLLGLLTIRRLPEHIGSTGILPFLQSFVTCCLPTLSDPRLSSAACAVLRALAEAVRPFGIESFEPALQSLWSGMRRRSGRPASVFLRTLATLVPLVEPAEAPAFAAPLLAQALSDFSSSDEEVRRIALLTTTLAASAASQEQIGNIVPQLFHYFWTPSVAVDQRMNRLVVHTTSELPAENSAIVAELVSRNVLLSNSNELQQMGLSLLSKLGVAQLLLDRRLEERLIDGLIATSPHPAGVQAVVNVTTSLGPERVASHARKWVQSLMEQQADPEEAQREYSAKVIGALAPSLAPAELLLLQRHLYEQLGEEYPDVLAELLNAQRVVLSLSRDNSFEPPASTLLPCLSPILRNRNERVQEACIRLIKLLAEADGDAVSAREWMNVCFELLQLQASHRITIRRLATSTFAAIADIIGPQDVVVSLLGQLRSTDRQLRVTSAAAIAAVGAQTGPFTVLPIVLNEYRSQEILVQHGILKTLAFLFEFMDRGQAVHYVDSVVTLVDHALLETNAVHRQTAASIVYHLALGCVGQGKEDIFVHFLNELMPSVFETSPHVIDRVLEAFEAIHRVIGTPAIVNYLWAGLFHPARKVRAAYWKLWNLVYVQNGDALVPTYPLKVPSPGGMEEDVRDLWV